MRHPYLHLCLGMLLAAGCADDPTDDAIREAHQVEQCNADFTVDVTAGPEAGFHAGGPLALYPIGGGALTGYLDDASRGPIAVVGSQSAQQLMLSFRLADGRTIVGVGPAPGADCAGMREGFAVGPSLDPSFSPSAPGTSVGHWLAANLVPQTIDYTITYQGGLSSSDFGFLDNASAQINCGGEGRPQILVTCRDGRDPVRDAIAHFFGVPYCSEAESACRMNGGVVVTQS